MILTEKQRQTLLNSLKTSGVFITAGKEDANVMSTHSGALGKIWGKDVFILPIRKNKKTHTIIENDKTFAISVPIKDMSAEIAVCDRLSGYDTNKFEELQLHPKRAEKIDTYILGECGLIMECRVIFSSDVTLDSIDPNLFKEFYNDKEFHTMYFAEVITAYEL